MKNAPLSYKIASWTLLLGGIIHTTADLLAPKTAQQKEFLLQMEKFTGQLFGTEFNLFSFHQGFSLMMGLLLFGYGALNLLILRNTPQTLLPYDILLFNVIVSLVAVTLSIQFFFLIPVVLTGVPFLGFTIALFTRIKQAKQLPHSYSS